MKKILLLVLIPIACHAMEKDSKWDAEQYDAHSKQQYEACLEYLTNFDFPDATPLEDRVFVDLGCGTANAACYLAKKYSGTHIVGIDPAQNEIDYARKKHGEQGNLSFICNTAQDFKLTDQYLPPANFVAFYHALHYIPKDLQQDALNNIANNMAEEGILDVATVAKQKKLPLFAAGIQTFLKPKWWSNCFEFIHNKIESLSTEEKEEFEILSSISQDEPLEPTDMVLSEFGKLLRHKAATMLSEDEIEQLALNAGLEVIRCEETEKSFCYNSKEDFIPWVTAVLGPYGLKAVFEVEQLKNFVADTVDL